MVVTFGCLYVHNLRMICFRGVVDPDNTLGTLGVHGPQRGSTSGHTPVIFMVPTESEVYAPGVCVTPEDRRSDPYLYFPRHKYSVHHKNNIYKST